MTPKALLDRPALQSSNRHLLEAFYELSAGRSVGEVPQPVSTTDIRSYCELFAIRSQDERDRLFKIVRRLDMVFLKHLAGKREPLVRKAL